MAKPRPGEKELAVWAVNRIRENGGVVEHPMASTLWNYLHLPVDNRADRYGGWTLTIDQKWFGHRAEKRTRLYICGIDPKDIPRFPLTIEDAECVVNTCLKAGDPGYRKKLSKKERESTPVAFAKWLLMLADKCVIRRK